jgi:hypothetical protein
MIAIPKVRGESSCVPPGRARLRRRQQNRHATCRPEQALPVELTIGKGGDGQGEFSSREDWPDLPASTSPT